MSRRRKNLFVGQKQSQCPRGSSVTCSVRKKKERKEKKYERVRGKRLLGGRWLEPLGEVGGQKTSEKSSVVLDGVRRYSQTVRQRRQTDRQTCGKE